MRFTPLVGRKVWFGPRRGGWGWDPASWEGWASIAASFGVLVLASRFDASVQLAVSIASLVALVATVVLKGTSWGGADAAERFQEVRASGKRTPEMVEADRQRRRATDDEPSVRDAARRLPRRAGPPPAALIFRKLQSSFPWILPIWADTARVQTRSQDLIQDHVEIDLRGDGEEESWVTVSEASERSGLARATIRQLYRSGRVPTQRADGDRGAFLVPLTAVLRLGEDADASGDALGEPILDINATYWSIETQAAREETAAVRLVLDEVRERLDFLRDQLAEATVAERAATARADALEAELATLRQIRAAGSIVDPSWLELSTNGYGSPARSQGLALPLADVAPLLSDAPVGAAADADADAELAAAEAELQAEAPKVEHPRPGDHADDMLPASGKKGRRGRH